MNASVNPVPALAGAPDAASVEPLPAGQVAMTGLKIVVNGRTVVHRHFLQQAMDAMVRCAVAEESLATPG